MLTRRTLLVGALATGLILRPRTSRATASQPATPVTFAVPAGACDCHTHIHGDPARFPFFAGRTYTPGDGAARGDGGAPQGAPHPARGDRHPQRLRHR